MNVQKYLTMACKIRTTSESIDPETGMRETEVAERDVPCYKQSTSMLYRDARGEMINATSKVYLQTEVKPGDYIDGFEVKQVDSIYDFDGSLSHYEVLL